MALSSEEKLPSLLERCLNGTPKIQLDLNRINRLASLGLPRRVPCSDHNQGISPVQHSDSKNNSPFSTVARNQDSVGAAKSTSNSVDPSEARKRKAEKDAPSCRERTLARQEARSYLNLRSNADSGADTKNRKAIDSAKELLSNHDKENINPYYGLISRREPKKQVTDRSVEKRVLQASKKVQNAPGSRKVGSLLVNQSVKSKVGSFLSGIPQPSVFSQNGFMEKSRADCLKTAPPYYQAESEVVTPVGSMSLSHITILKNHSCNDVLPTQVNGEREEISLEMPEQAGSKPSSNTEEQQDLRANSLLVEGNQGGAVLTTVKELSSSMNSLAIVDCHHHQSPSMLEKAEVKKEIICSNKSIQTHRSFISEKHHESNVQIGAPVSCPSLAAVPVPHVAAWSYTIRTGSAPLPTSLTEESVQPLNQDQLHPLCKQSPDLDNGILKTSPGSLPSLVSNEQQENELKRAEKHPSMNPSMENPVRKEGEARHSRDDILMPDAGSAKLLQHWPERKAINGGEASLQPKKQGENESFVWVNGKKYQKLKKIGRGGSSEVYMVIDRDSTIYALKRIKLKGRDYATACGFYQEIELLTRLQGRNYIIRLIDHEVTDKNLFSKEMEGSYVIRHDAYIYMVLEYGEVDLATMLQDKLKERVPGGDNNVDERWLRFYWQQILEAVNTVHEERIIHADLKPANFLLVKGSLKLIDFGIAKSIQGDTTNIERDAQVGTLNYMSPEAFLMNEKDEHGNTIRCGRPSDIWALGCILYQMVYGKTPFAHITALHAKIQEVANPNHNINFPPVSNPHLLDIMKKCLAYNRDQRLRIPELLRHPFLQPMAPHPEEKEDGIDVASMKRHLAKVETALRLKIQQEEGKDRYGRTLISLLETMNLFEEL